MRLPSSFSTRTAASFVFPRISGGVLAPPELSSRPGLLGITSLPTQESSPAFICDGLKRTAHERSKMARVRRMVGLLNQKQARLMYLRDVSGAIVGQTTRKPHTGTVKQTFLSVPARTSLSVP